MNAGVLPVERTQVLQAGLSADRYVVTTAPGAATAVFCGNGSGIWRQHDRVRGTGYDYLHILPTLEGWLVGKQSGAPTV